MTISYLFLAYHNKITVGILEKKMNEAVEFNQAHLVIENREP